MLLIIFETVFFKKIKPFHFYFSAGKESSRDKNGQTIVDTVRKKRSIRKVEDFC